MTAAIIGVVAALTVSTVAARIVYALVWRLTLANLLQRDAAFENAASAFRDFARAFNATSPAATTEP